jgi:transposase
MKEQLTLFELPSTIENNVSQDLYKGKPRLNYATRSQVEMKMCSLDDLLPKAHLARDIWRYVEGLDLGIALRQIQSVEGCAGRSAIDPKILLTLWLYATINGIGSARLLAEYCTMHDAYKWICGSVSVNYHTLSDFRVSHGELFDQLLTESVAILAKAKIISLEAVSQDGIRVRANAGGSSFKRGPTLQFNLELAGMLVADLKEEAQKNPGACRTRMEAAQLRAAEEKEKNLKNALAELQEVRKSKIRRGKKEQRQVKDEDLKHARASMTDPDARIMKMPDGGFRPAYNVQFASTNKGKAIIGVDVTKSGSDQQQTLGMIRQVEKRYHQIPKKWLQDGGYNNKAEYEKTVKAYKDCKIYMPTKECAKKENDSAVLRELRGRMETDDGKNIYKERAATAEYANAQARNRGLRQFLVRGLSKVKNIALMFALAHNVEILLRS